MNIRSPHKTIPEQIFNLTTDLLPALGVLAAVIYLAKGGL